jgi:two-component system, LytTR family, response regulator
VAELRVLLVDDGPLVRQGICDFLEGEPDVVIVGECGNGVEALETIARERVDLVFLDIQMPELDGVGVAAALTAQDGPAVVFVTAYSEHALRAFEVNAVDYVLKPFDRERFRAALGRARIRLAAGERGELAGRLAAVLAELQRSRGYAQRILVRSEGRARLVPVAEVDWIEAADNYVRVHAGSERHLVRETMAAMDLARIRELQPTFNGEYAVLLHTGVKLTLSRGYRDALRSRLGDGW